MRTLYLHIGFHKTGSTSLQLALTRGREQLLAEGYEFVALGKKGNSSGAIDVGKHDGRVCYSLNERFDQLLSSSKAEHVIVSAEHFSFFHTPEEIGQVQRLCERYFDRTVVVVYLRRQDRQAVSFKQQAARGCERDRSSSSKLLGHDGGAFPQLTECVRAYYDYSAKLHLWAERFGKDALRVRRFQASDLEGGDIVTDFVALLGTGVELEPCRVNECVSRKEFVLSHRLIELGLDPRQLKKLKPRMQRDETRLKPARNSAEAFYRQFESSNRDLDQHFLPHASGLAFSDDFDGYPEVGNDRLLVEDVADWTVDLLETGLRKPLELRDALLLEPLQALCDEAGVETERGRELLSLRQCLEPTAAVEPEPNRWWERLRGRKRNGR
ncbi:MULTISPECIES: hypothetical protein [Microbulbifer]|uniref:hypothetical protein n=1 Tax=Microbulbifer TaxID=48073 RepID=UPI000A8050E0|nr:MULTISPECIES: hypothetical protein [Microbulbifer]